MQDRFRLEDEEDRAALRAAKAHFSRAAEKVIADAFYNARISAVNYYYKKVKGENMRKQLGANRIYLLEEEYLQSKVDWIVKDIDAWRWLAKRWSSPEWIANSEKKRINRGGTPGHRYGADGHIGVARRMVSNL
jgi:hypothetical protein